MHPDDLYQSVGASVDGPMPLVILTHGWIEASETVARVLETIVSQADLSVIAEFDTDQLLDQRARRPTMTVIDGVMDQVDWPQLELAVGTDRNDNPFLLLHGPEPDFRWRPFAKAVATLAGAVGVTTMYTMGAYPAPLPHTRPIRVSTTATRPEMLIGRDHTGGSIVVPIGVFSAVAEEMKRFGTETIGLWAQVPYYVSTNPWPQASHGLLANLGQVGALDFDLSGLESEMADALSAIEAVLEATPNLQSVVEDLERRFDDLEKLEADNVLANDLSTGDQLEQQVQQYLRNIEGD